MSHTPGPWEVIENGEGQYADAGGDDCDDQTYPAYWIKGPRFLQFDWNQYAFTLADARLIAAAPELLAACQEAVEAFGFSSDAVIRQLHDAIAKATGNVD